MDTMVEERFNQIWDYIRKNARYHLPKGAVWISENSESDQYDDWQLADGTEITFAKKDIEAIARKYPYDVNQTLEEYVLTTMIKEQIEYKEGDLL